MSRVPCRFPRPEDGTRNSSHILAGMGVFDGSIDIETRDRRAERIQREFNPLFSWLGDLAPLRTTGQFEEPGDMEASAPVR